MKFCMLDISEVLQYCFRVRGASEWDWTIYRDNVCTSFWFLLLLHVWSYLFSDLDFECLATWKDGSDYLYGRYSGTGMHDRERQYRCFVSRTGLLLNICSCFSATSNTSSSDKNHIVIFGYFTLWHFWQYVGYFDNFDFKFACVSEVPHFTKEMCTCYELYKK